MNGIDLYGSHLRVPMKLQTISDTRQPCGWVHDVESVLKVNSLYGNWASLFQQIILRRVYVFYTWKLQKHKNGSLTVLKLPFYFRLIRPAFWLICGVAIVNFPKCFEIMQVLQGVAKWFFSFYPQFVKEFQSLSSF